jgi:hypothetical protein
MSQIFKLNNGNIAVCESLNTRNGFKHEATLFNTLGNDIDTVKVCYLNRTWESFTYETVLNKLLNKHGLKRVRE